MSSFNYKTTNLHTSYTYYGQMAGFCDTGILEFPPNYYSVVKAGDFVERIENAFQILNNKNKRVDSNDGTLLTREEFLKKYNEDKWHDSISKDDFESQKQEKIDNYYFRLEILLEKLHNFEKDDFIVPILTCFDFFIDNIYDEFNERCKSEQKCEKFNEDNLRCHPIIIDIYLDMIMNKIEHDINDDENNTMLEIISFKAFEANAWTILENEGVVNILLLIIVQ